MSSPAQHRLDPLRRLPHQAGEFVAALGRLLLGDDQRDGGDAFAVAIADRRGDAHDREIGFAQMHGEALRESHFGLAGEAHRIGTDAHRRLIGNQISLGARPAIRAVAPP